MSTHLDLHAIFPLVLLFNPFECAQLTTEKLFEERQELRLGKVH